MSDHEALECRTIVCPWLDESERKSPEDFDRIGKILNGIGTKLRTRGFRFLYHNHDFEFTVAQNPDGLARILAQTDPRNLSAQLDVYWAYSTGHDPVKMIGELGPRLASLHLKDGRPAEQIFTPVGQGALDFPAILKAGIERGVLSFIVEQDTHASTPTESVRQSLEYLRQLGLTG